MKIFNYKKIDNYYKTTYKFNILGIKFNISRRCKSLQNKYRQNYNQYLKKKKDKIHRLIITTGNLSLINSIAMINQLNLTENAENSLVIWSHITNPEFENIMHEISKLLPFKNIYTFYNSNSTLSSVISFFMKNNIVEFDEIYFPNIFFMFNAVNTLFPKTPYYLTDEGVCALFKNQKYDYSNVKNYIFTRYLDKLDFLCATEKDMKKIICLDKKEVLKVFQQCEALFPLCTEINPEDKNVILCGTYKELGFWSEKQIIDYQNEIIEKLIKNGYTVLFKPHPRDSKVPKESNKFKIFNAKLPLECYSLENKCVAVVSLFSSASVQMYYYQGIPGFCAANLIKNINNIGVNIIEEYSPPIEELLSVNADSKTKNQVKQELINKFENFIRNKSLLSENKYLKKRYAKHEYPFFCQKFW